MGTLLYILPCKLFESFRYLLIQYLYFYLSNKGVCLLIVFKKKKSDLPHCFSIKKCHLYPFFNLLAQNKGKQFLRSYECFLRYNYKEKALMWWLIRKYFAVHRCIIIFYAGPVLHLVDYQNRFFRIILSKVHIFWESNKILRNLDLTFDYIGQK